MVTMDLDIDVLNYTRPVVYVVQEVKNKNLVPALEFGSLETVLEAEVQVFLNSKQVVEHVQQKLVFYSDKDYILAIGDPVAIGIVCAVAASMNEGRFTVLKWDRQERVYIPVSVDLNL